MKLYYHEKDYLLAQCLQRFYSLLNIMVEIAPVSYEWFVRHIVFPNTRDAYSWKNEDWWMNIYSGPGYAPEVMGHFLDVFYHPEAAWRFAPDWLLEPMEMIRDEVLNFGQYRFSREI